MTFVYLPKLNQGRNMKLIGSIASPFVRRVRVILENYNIPYEFVVTSVASVEGQKILSEIGNSIGSIRRVPVLVLNDGNSIFDSTIIVEYLQASKGKTISVEEKMNLKLIDEVNDSLVHLYQNKMYKDDIHWQSNFSKNHLRRVMDSFELLNVKASQFHQDSLEALWLFCLIDWTMFRNIVELNNFSGLMSFYEMNKNKAVYLKTSPRV